jgi:hypothetical protein
MKCIKISEKQDREIKNLIKETLDSNGGQLSLKYTPAGGRKPRTPGEIGNAVVAAAKAGEKVSNNTNINTDVSITADPDGDKKSQEITVGNDNQVTESFIISMEQLNEMRLKKLKENSEIVKIDKFLE